MAPNAPGNTPGNNPNPAPQSEVDRVLQAAVDLKNEELNPTEFEAVVDNSQEIADRAKTALRTREQWEQLRTIIDEEQAEAENQAVVTAGRANLDALRTEIDAGIAATTQTVQDLEAPVDPNKPKTLVDQMKDMFGNVGTGAAGMLVRGWISLQRTLIDLGVVKGDVDKLGKIEELYGKWFGGAEMRDMMKKTLENAGIEIRKGQKEGVAYHQLTSEYQKELIKQLTHKGPDGNDLPVSAAEINALKTSFTMKVFLEQKAEEYAKKNVAAAVPGEKRVTTLMGVLRGEKPGVEKV